MEPITIPPTIEGIEQALDRILSENTPTKNTVLSTLKKERILREYKRMIPGRSREEAMQLVAEATGETFTTVHYVIRRWQYQATNN